MRNERLRNDVASKSTPNLAATNGVTVTLGDIIPLLADAAASERTWLHDFADDEITISPDLYELILAYQHYHRPAA